MSSHRSSSENFGGAIRYVFSPAVFKRNILLAAIVGCLLTMANQLDVLFTQRFTFRMATKILFNFLIPFVVSSTSAVLNRRPGHR